MTARSVWLTYGDEFTPTAEDAVVYSSDFVMELAAFRQCVEDPGVYGVAIVEGSVVRVVERMREPHCCIICSEIVDG